LQLFFFSGSTPGDRHRNFEENAMTVFCPKCKTEILIEEEMISPATYRFDFPVCETRWFIKMEFFDAKKSLVPSTFVTLKVKDA